MFSRAIPKLGYMSVNKIPRLSINLANNPQIIPGTSVPKFNTQKTTQSEILSNGQKLQTINSAISSPLIGTQPVLYPLKFIDKY